MQKPVSTGIQESESVRVIKTRMVVFHLLCLGIFFVPVNAQIVLWTVITYFFRVFIWEAGSHRYFAHRSFKTSRAFQLILAVLAAAGGQRGPIWWAQQHRDHHRTSDQPDDPHSPVHRGVWFSHVGWFMDPRYKNTDLDKAKDLSKYPELVWVNQYHYLFPLFVLIGTYLLGQFTSMFGEPGLGISAVIWVFVLSTVLSVHATFSVNTLTHGMKPNALNLRRFDTTDTTTNSWLLAIPTMGAAWHNNHHRFMNSARAGFYWWEIDLTYLLLKMLSWFGIVWDLQKVPERIMEEGRRPAGQLSAGQAPSSAPLRRTPRSAR